MKFWDDSLLVLDEQNQVSILSFVQKPTWECFGFRFQAIQTNQEYMERENEFDSEEKTSSLAPLTLPSHPQKVDLSLKRTLIDFEF